MRASLLASVALVSVTCGIAVNYQEICNTISTTISSKSIVYYPTPNPSATRTPFSVKSGGHPLNPGFSSSQAVQIAMYRFSEVKYDPETQTVMMGTGLNFDDVYAALAPHNVSVAGGRDSADCIRDAAIAEGQDIANVPLYPNYAIFGTPLGDMYGDNVGRLKSLRETIDPLDVMCLAGGFNFCWMVVRRWIQVRENQQAYVEFPKSPGTVQRDIEWRIFVSQIRVKTWLPPHTLIISGSVPAVLSGGNNSSKQWFPVPPPFWPWILKPI
ncbi:hypothetical protein F5887DRAFT_1184312 [Amanita rubescens]|nr:hypothetical protein F5887DRAFT_1184312 [Amanita rubescens]